MSVCEICPHRCNLKEGQKGLCNARINRGGKVVCENYAKITSIALDPIEKKPLKRFYPGSLILSVGSYGCNFKCPFCQNSDISMSDGRDIRTVGVTPNELVKTALEYKKSGNIGIAYTYNEPLIGYEYVYDCAKAAKAVGLKNVIVTNGYICEQPLKELLPFIDAMNIDLKAIRDDFYKKIGGDLDTVKRTIEIASKSCHIEVTTLIIPGENDSESDMEELSLWISSVDKNIPLHITRFFPRWKMSDKNATDIDIIYKLSCIARKNLTYIYEGNV